MQKKIDSLMEAIRKERCLILPASSVPPVIIRINHKEGEQPQVRRLGMATVLPAHS